MKLNSCTNDKELGNLNRKHLHQLKTNKEIKDSYQLQISILISFSSDFVRKGIKNKFNFRGLQNLGSNWREQFRPQLNISLT